VDKVEGNSMSISTSRGAVQVTVKEGTPIRKLVSGSLSDLKPGERVLVIGEKGSTGSFEAASIQVLPARMGAPSRAQPGAGPPSSAP
jgi:ABC-type microcin C transport system duplicated ATPase subunit YejF